MILHPRSEWTTVPCTTPTPARGQGTGYLHHEGGGIRGNPADKPRVLREIEAYVVVGKGYAAIDYNLMVFQDGSVWEGRGLDHEDAATLNWNSRSVSVCAVGNFDRESPTDALLNGIADAFRLAMASGWLSVAPTILGHRDSGFSTACPGSLLYPMLPTIRDRVFSGTTPTPPPPAPAPAAPPKDGPVDTIHYNLPGQDAFHTFWIGTDYTKPDGTKVKRAGHLLHTWEPAGGGAPGFEDLSGPGRPGQYEALRADRGLSVFIGPNLDLIVQGVAVDGAVVEFRWAAKGGPWGARIIGR